MRVQFSAQFPKKLGDPRHTLRKETGLGTHRARHRLGHGSARSLVIGH